MFNYIPLTILVESNSESYKKEIEKFRSVFNLFENYDQKGLSNDKLEERNLEINEKLQNFPLFINKSGKSSIKLQLPTSHFDGYNMWFLKCTQFNRGKGIYVFNRLEQLVSLLTEINKGIVLSEANEIINQNADTTKRQAMQGFNSADASQPKIQSSTFVIQKYIEKPLLINHRKFDIRVWVLITNSLKVYFFKEGYLRTSCEVFSLSQENITNESVHLTNNAIQINSENYGKFEDGNQISFAQLQEYFDANYTHMKISVRNDIVEEMKKLVTLTFLSSRDHFSTQNKSSSFEIFGFDFIIDESFKTWLIEVNTNPCLEESSPLLKSLLPRMLDDAFKLTIDQMFRKKRKNLAQDDPDTLDLTKKSSKYQDFPVEGYANDENLWEIIL